MVRVLLQSRKHVYASSVPTGADIDIMTDVYAFDYNGTLNTDEGLQLYKSKVKEPDVSVGILTSNLVYNATRFTEEENLDPDFVRRGLLKSPELVYISQFISGDAVYVGNANRDELAAKIAGWQYIDVDDI